MKTVLQNETAIKEEREEKKREKEKGKEGKENQINSQDAEEWTESERWYEPEEDLSGIGSVIAFERKYLGLTRLEICEGLCSERFLGRLERGERGCEKVVADALLERMGVASDRFLYFIGPEEEQCLLARENLVQAIHEEHWEEIADRRREYETYSEKADKQHEQFRLLAEVVAEWKKESIVCQREALENQDKKRSWATRLLLAWQMTRKEYPICGNTSFRMSFQEQFIKSMYLRIREESGNWQEALAGYRELLQYLRKNVDRSDRVRLYPQIAYRVLLLLRDKPVSEAEYRLEAGRTIQEEAKALWEDCMTLLRGQGGLYQLPELLDYEAERLRREYEGELPPKAEKRVTELMEIAASIRWLYEKYQEKPLEWGWYIPFGMEELYCIRDVIAGRRKGYGLSERELAEGICEEREIRRLESGKVGPKKGVLTRLMKKLAFPGGNGTLAAQVGDPALCQVVWEILDKTSFGEYDGVKEKLELLKQEKGKNRYIDQNLWELEATTLYALNEIDAKEHQKRMWDAFYLTVPEKEPEELTEWAFMKREAVILNVLAHSYDKLRRQKEGIAWMRLLKAYYERQPFVKEHYRNNYELALQNLGNLLGNIREYEEAIEMGKLAIPLALRAGRTNILRRSLYDMGWNMEKLWETGSYTKEESRPYIQTALAFAKFYKKQNNIAHIEQHLKDLYGED